MTRIQFRFKSLLLLTLFVALNALGALAQEKSALLLYKSSEEASPTVSRLGQRVDPVLKKLGYQVIYHDVDKGLPTDTQASLLVSWYSTPKIADPEGYVDWLAAQISLGRKVAVLGNFGAHTKDGQTWMTNESLNRFFYPFGLKYGAAYTGDSNVLRITKQELPAKQPVPVNYYLLFESVNAANVVYLEVERTDLAGSKSALVVRTPYGGMAQEVFVDNLDLEGFFKEIVSSKKVAATTSKKLLGLYKASEGVDERTNFLARFVAPTLFDLGYGIDYHNIEQGLPGEAKMASYAGVISWYNTPQLSNADDYINWLLAQNEANRRVIVLGNFGAFAQDIKSSAGTVTRFLQSPEYNRFFYPFGLEFRAAWTPQKQNVEVVNIDKSVMVWLEPGHVGHYYWIRSVHPDNRAYLTVRRTDLQDGESAVVVATPKGGLALESYILSTDPTTKQPRMHIDLKKFLSAALTLQAVSKVDLRPNLTELKSRPALPALVLPKLGGDGIYPPDVTPQSRKILAFYQSSINESQSLNATALAAQMVLEHLGFVVVYHDLDNPDLPSMEEMKSFRGIVVWLSSTAVPRAREFDHWLRENIKSGRRIALFGDYNLREKSTLSLVSPVELYAALGLHYDPLGNAPLISNVKGQGTVRSVAPKDPKVINQRAEWLGFERELRWDDKDIKNNWALVQNIWPDSEVGLTVGQAHGASDVLVHSKTGSVCLGPFAMYDKGAERKLLTESAEDKSGAKAAQPEKVAINEWRIDPFIFFTKVFGADSMPKPDFTTLNGSRIFYSHIDGDAFGGISHIDFSSLNGEMMLKRVIEPLKLPITVSFVTKDVEKRLDDFYSRELQVAQQILALPNVEPACHTFSHPFDWEKGDLAIDDSKGDYVLKRKPIDLEQEVKHSTDFIDKLCPPDKRCEIFLWSGKCNPKPQALKLVRETGIINMNGGESVIEESNPLISGVAPIIGEVEGETQFHVSAAGDYYYTNSWLGPYDGMKGLPFYYDKTESPRRLRCLNVYYHFYLAEREPGIQGLEVAYNDVLRRIPAPMFASEYAKLLRDWTETKIGTDASGRYYIANSGLCNTVRFDAENRYPDLTKSQGVVGFNRANGALYVHLAGTGAARIALTESAPKTPYISKFTHPVKSWSTTPELLTWETEGQGPVHLELSGLIPASQYRIEAGSIESIVSTNSQGTLVWKSQFDGYRVKRKVRVRKVTK